jgi:acyl-CoA thioesterase
MALDHSLEALVRERLRHSSFATWMGITLVGIGDGDSELRLDLEPHHLNPGGIVHGGVLATLLDACIGLALRTKLGMESEHVTIKLDVNYLSPARTGALIGRGKAVRTGGRVSYGEAELFTEDGTLVAKGAATFLVVKAQWARERKIGGDA